MIIHFFLCSWIGEYFTILRPKEKHIWCFPGTKARIIISLATIIGPLTAFIYYKKKAIDMAILVVNALLYTFMSVFFSLYISSSLELYYSLAYFCMNLALTIFISLQLKYIISYTNKWRYVSVCIATSCFNLMELFYGYFGKNWNFVKYFGDKKESLLIGFSCYFWFYVLVIGAICVRQFRVEEKVKEKNSERGR